MNTSSSLGTSTNNKQSQTSFVPHSDDYQYLLIENGQLHKKLEAARAHQKALDMENGELKIKGATLDKDNCTILYDLHAVQKENEFGNATLQSTKQCIQEVKTQASSLAKVAQATAVAAKAFLQAESDCNGAKNQMQYAACNSAVDDVIQQYHAIMNTNSDVTAANNSKPIAVSDDNEEDNNFD